MKYIWYMSQPGFDPSFENLKCLATLKSCDTIKLFVDENVCSPTPVGLNSLTKEIMVTTRVRQGSSNELSSC